MTETSPLSGVFEKVLFPAMGTSQSIPSWNQILGFLQQMAKLREVSGSAA